MNVHYLPLTVPAIWYVKNLSIPTPFPGALSQEVQSFIRQIIVGNLLLLKDNNYLVIFLKDLYIICINYMGT